MKGSSRKRRTATPAKVAEQAAETAAPQLAADEPRTWIALLLLGSGFCALVYQAAWMRSFRVLFGSSTLATSAVLAIFMGGLGFGGLRLGRRAQRHRRPLLLYGQLEALIAIAAAISPALLWLARAIYLGVGGSQTLGNAGATIVRLVLATMVIGVPVFLMGGTLPAAARAATRDRDVGRKAVALLYGVNTVGGVLGALLPTFAMFEHLGTRLTLWVAVAINLTIAAIAWRWSRTSPPQEVAPEPTTPPANTTWVLAAAFVTGFVFLLAELVWYRMAAPILGGSTFTFGLILACALLGIGLGGLLYSVLGPTQPTATHFALTCALEALALIIPFALGDRLAVIAQQAALLGGSGFPDLVAGWLLITAILVFPAALIAGYQFPALLALKGRGRESIAFDVGQVYAANTVGAILGALLGGFVLVPALTAPNAWRVAAVAMAVIALLVGIRYARHTPRKLAVIVGVATMAVAGAFALGPTAVWRQSGIGAGRGDLDTSSRNGLVASFHMHREQLAFEDEGVESSLGVIVNHEGLAFLTNGKSDGSALADAWTTLLLGAIGGVMHPHPKTALVIGLGSGETAGVLGRDPSITHVDVAELEPAVLEYARACHLANFDVLANPKVEIHIGDARELVATTRASYDLIASEPSNPYRAGVGGLFSLEFYEQARARLAQGGLFLQWIQGYEIDATTLALAIATMKHAFPHVSVWMLGIGDYALVGSGEPQVIDSDRVRERLAIEPYRTVLGRIAGVYDVEGLVARHLAGDDFATAAATTIGGELNTDDRTLIEYRFARSAGRGQGVGAEELLAAATVRHAERPTVVGSALDWKRVAYLRFRPWHVQESQTTLPITPEVEPWLRLWSRDNVGPSPEAELARQMGVPDPATDLPPVPARDLFERLVRLQKEATRPARQRDQLEAEAAELANAGYAGDVAWVELAAALVDRQLDRLPMLISTAFEALRTDPWIRRSFVEHTLERLLAVDNTAAKQTALRELLVGPFALHQLEPSRQLTAESLAVQLADWESCAVAFELAEPWPVWTYDLLRLRASCYEHARTARLAQAKADVQEFEANRSEPLGSLLGSGALAPSGSGVYVPHP